MHITLVSVGKLKKGPEKELVDDYVSRFNKSGPLIGLRLLKLVDLSSGGGVDAEGKLILSAVPAGAKVLRLDEHGPAWPSVKLAQQIGKWRDAGTPNLCILIGGAEGYSDAVRAAFPDTLALGPQTWPHRLVKAMISEQLYRSVSLLAGLPYHKA